MRKSLVAIALACAFPAAFAQSSVTLYGILDAGYRSARCGQHYGVPGCRAPECGRETASASAAAKTWAAATARSSRSKAVFRSTPARSPTTNPSTGAGCPARRRLPVCPGVTIVPGTAIALAAADQPDLPGGSRRAERHQQRAAAGDHDGQWRRGALRPPVVGAAWSPPTARCCSAGSTRRAMKS